MKLWSDTKIELFSFEHKIDSFNPPSFPQFSEKTDYFLGFLALSLSGKVMDLLSLSICTSSLPLLSGKAER